MKLLLSAFKLFCNVRGELRQYLLSAYTILNILNSFYYFRKKSAGYVIAVHLETRNIFRVPSLILGFLANRLSFGVS
jgi:hypothetical protein